MRGCRTILLGRPSATSRGRGRCHPASRRNTATRARRPVPRRHRPGDRDRRGADRRRNDGRGRTGTGPLRHRGLGATRGCDRARVDDRDPAACRERGILADREPHGRRSPARSGRDRCPRQQKRSSRVFGNVRAMEAAIALSRTIDESTILDIHRALMGSDDEQTGSLRTAGVDRWQQRRTSSC